MSRDVALSALWLSVHDWIVPHCSGCSVRLSTRLEVPYFGYSRTHGGEYTFLLHCQTKNIYPSIPTVTSFSNHIVCLLTWQRLYLRVTTVASARPISSVTYPSSEIARPVLRAVKRQRADLRTLGFQTVADQTLCRSLHFVRVELRWSVMSDWWRFKGKNSLSVLAPLMRTVNTSANYSANEYLLEIWRKGAYR